MAVAGVRASLLLASSIAASSSPRPRLLVLPPRHRRPRGSLASQAAAAGGGSGCAWRGRSPPASPSASARRSSRYVGRRGFLRKVLAVRFEPDAGVLGCSAFVVGAQLPEPLTGKLWTLDDFEGNPALLISHSSCIACAKCF